MKQSTTDNFFKQSKEKSKIKVFIVTEFFKTYFSIINNRKFADEIYYIDLFSGPGKYEDDTKSTPLVLMDIINDFKSDDIREKLITLFNDECKDFHDSLEETLKEHPAYNRMKHKPIILNKKAHDVDLSFYYNNNKPKFVFIDPWGYVDVSAEQIGKLVKSIGSDCILFFNSNRILQDLSKPNSRNHMEKIFGSEIESAIKLQQSNKSQQTKAHGFVTLFSKNLYNEYFRKLKDQGYRLFVLPFVIEQDDVEKTSHYIIFISKNHKAICEMKKIMVKKSNTNSEILGFDNKDIIKLSLFSREDDVKIGIKNLIKQMLSDTPQLYQKEKTVSEWLEIIDAYYMNKNYEVTPYTVDELKVVITEWDNEGKINVILPQTQTIKRITNDRKFGFAK